MRDQEIRCFCNRSPLLAVCGVDSITRQPFVHIKAYRQNRIFAEVVITSGTARIRCRECLRWHKVTIRVETVDTVVERLPESIAI